MKTLYQLNDEVRYFVQSQFRWQGRSMDIHEKFIKEFKPKLLKTATGKNRYPAYYERVLNQVYHAVLNVLIDEYIIFGYWYENEFYTTVKTVTEHKTTDILHDMKLDQAVWDKMPRGMYYRGSLKEYFVE